MEQIAANESLNGWEGFFVEVIALLDEAQKNYGIANHNYTDYALERMEMALSTCSEMQHILLNASLDGEMQECCTTLTELISCIRFIYRKWCEYEGILDSRANLSTSMAYQASSSTSSAAGAGRPQFDISKEQLEYLSSLGFKWTEVAALLGVSRMTIYRRRVDYGLVNDPQSEISDRDLESLITSIRRDMPYSGISMMCGSLRSRGIRVTRERVRNLLRTIDPLGSGLRSPAGLTHRRPYSVPGPNSLWHIDTHHKLIRWRLVTLGGIDGYSRLVVYLQCCSNNRATTILDAFLSAVHTHQVPSRVRSDQGRENLRVAQYMLEMRGAERRSIITGSSVHNQRIERLWRDMHKSVTVLYYKLFYFMEHHDILNQLNEHHLWALHYIFLPRINKSLREFVNSWNNHPIRTANHKSPHQLFTAGALLLQNSGLAAMDFFENVTDSYGIDLDGPVPLDDDEGNIIIPQNPLKFSSGDLAILHQQVNPLGSTSNYGIDLYERTLNLLSTFTPL